MDSCNVGPALLADGVGGNGSTVPSSGVAAKTAVVKPHRAARSEGFVFMVISLVIV
jgi:hypothetical protein